MVKGLIVITINGTFLWPYVTYIFRSG